MTSTSSPTTGGPPTNGLPPDLQASLEDSLISSPNCVELAPQPAMAYKQRLATTDRSIAELFHVNSRLRRSSAENQAADPGLLSKVRSWHHATAYRPDPSDLDIEVATELGIRRPTGDEAAEMPPFLKALAAVDLDTLTYAVDVWLVLDEAAMRVGVQLDALWLERRLTPGEDAAVRRSIVGLAGAAHGLLGFLVVTPWRYGMFLGPRGYRHCLVEAGRVLTAMEGSARTHGLVMLSSLDFIDDELERFLGLDGVERTVVAAFVVREGGDAR